MLQFFVLLHYFKSQELLTVYYTARKYKISVYTGNKRGAGTDADVYLTVFGENGDSGEKKLDSKKNNFERNQ